MVQSCREYLMKRENVMYESGIFFYMLIGFVIISFGSIILNIIQRQTIQKLKESSQTLIKDAYFNPLTSLPNEANFDILLKEQIDRALRHKQTFLLLYVKLKYYENDEDIINAANKISETIRNEDVVAHVGRAEFLILFNEYLEKENYNVVLERIVHSFPKYSIRLGTSTFPADGEDKKYLLKSAKEDAMK